VVSSSAVATVRWKSSSSCASYARRTGSPTTFEADGTGSGCSSARAPLALGGIGQHLQRAAFVKVETPSRCVRKRMVKHIQRPIVFAQDELEVVAVCNVLDGDGHQVRRSSPEQFHRDAVRRARRQFCPRNVVYGFEHCEIPSLCGRRCYATKIALKGFAPKADQCSSLHPDGGDFFVPATRQRRKVGRPWKLRRPPGVASSWPTTTSFCAKGWRACSSGPTSRSWVRPAMRTSSSSSSASTSRSLPSSTFGCRPRIQRRASKQRTRSARSFRKPASSSSRHTSRSRKRLSSLRPAIESATCSR